MIKLVYCLIGILLCVSCISNQSSKIDCDKSAKKIGEYIFHFQMKKDSTLLDSAYFLAEKIYLDCKGLKTSMTFRKLEILQMQKDFNKALKIIDSLDFILINDLPYYNHFLKYQYQIMKYQHDDSFSKRDSCLLEVESYLYNEIKRNESQLDSLVSLESSDEIYNKSIFILPLQYYTFISIIYGKEEAIEQLNKYKEDKGVNAEYCDYIKEQLVEDIMDIEIF